MSTVPESVSASAVTLSSPDGELAVTFLPRAGMIAPSLTHRGVELFAQRRGLAAYLHEAKTFGLPLLAPWANRLFGWDYTVGTTTVHLSDANPLVRRDPDTGWPIHGVLAACPDWSIAHRTRSSLSAELDYGANPDRLAAFPFPHHLRYAAELSASALRVTLTLTPTADLAVPVCFGLHPYLQPGGTRERWQLSGPMPGLDGPMGDRRFDDGHDGVLNAHFSVTSEQRTLSVDFIAGFSTVQVYSPPGADFICFEPMTAPTDALRTGTGLDLVAPGDSFSATFSITVGS